MIRCRTVCVDSERQQDTWIEDALNAFRGESYGEPTVLINHSPFVGGIYVTIYGDMSKTGADAFAAVAQPG